MKRAVIISGGKIQTDFALAFLRTQTWDYVIGADKGVIFCHKNQIMPTHIVGDFDSAGETEYEYFQKNTDIPIKKAQSGQRLYRHRCGSSSGTGTWGRRNYDPWRNRGTHRPYRCQCTDPVSCSAKRCAGISSG